MVLITTFPHYPLGDRRGYKVRLFRIEQASDLTTVRIGMPRMAHTGFGQRMFLYMYFAIMSAFPTLIYGRRKYVWAFSQRVFSTYTALVAGLVWRAKIVSDVTDVWPDALLNTGHAHADSPRYRAARIIAKLAYICSYRVVTLTERMRDIFVSGYGVPSSRILIVRNASNLGRRIHNVGEASDHSPSMATSDLTALRPKNSGFTVLYYGNLGKNYDFDPVIKAARQLATSDISFVIKGDGEWLGRLKDEARGLPNLRVLSKRVSNEELAGLIDSCDALVLPMANQKSVDVSLPIKFVEYLWSGKPMVFIGDGYPADLIERHNCGIVVEGGDTSALVSSMVALAFNPVLASKLASNAVRLAEREFSEEAFRISLKRAFALAA